MSSTFFFRFWCAALLTQFARAKRLGVVVVQNPSHLMDRATYLNIMFATIDASNPPEALTVEQALVAYTRGSAFAEFQEKNKGSLAPGMLADLAVLSQDIFKVPVDTLPRTVSVLTILGGRIVHER